MGRYLEKHWGLIEQEEEMLMTEIEELRSQRREFQNRRKRDHSYSRSRSTSPKKRKAQSPPRKSRSRSPININMKEGSPVITFTATTTNSIEDGSLPVTTDESMVLENATQSPIRRNSPPPEHMREYFQRPVNDNFNNYNNYNNHNNYNDRNNRNQYRNNQRGGGGAYYPPRDNRNTKPYRGKNNK